MAGALEQTLNMPLIVPTAAQDEQIGARYFMALKTTSIQEKLVSTRWQKHLNRSTSSQHAISSFKAALDDAIGAWCFTTLRTASLCIRTW